MKKFVPLIISLACATNIYALDKENAYINKVANTINYVNQNQDKVWPGFTMSNTFILQFAGTHHGYAFNFSPINPHWKKSIIDSLPVYALDKDEYNLEMGCDGCWIGGSTTVDNQLLDFEVFPKDLQDQDVPALVAARISFEGYFQKFSAPLWGSIWKPYDGYNQLMNVKLSYLERVVLTSYLNGHQSEDALRDAIAIHQYRSNFLSPISLSYENATQGIFGTVFYVMLKSLNVQANAFPSKLIDDGCAPDNITQYDSPVRTLHQCLWAGHPSFFGAIYGYALDNSSLSTKWKTQLINQLKAPASLLQDYYHLTEKEARDRTLNAMQDARYGYDKIEHDVDAALKPYLEEMAIQQDKYNKLEGLELLFGEIYAAHFTSMDAEYSINTWQRIYVNATGSGNLYVPGGGSCIMGYDHIPLLYSDKVKLSPDTKMVIDSLETTMGNFIKYGKTTAFTDLLIKDARFSLDIKGSKGHISVVDGKVQLSFPRDNVKKHTFSDIVKQMPKVSSKNKIMDILLR